MVTKKLENIAITRRFLLLLFLGLSLSFRRVFISRRPIDFYDAPNKTNCDFHLFSVRLSLDDAVLSVYPARLIGILFYPNEVTYSLFIFFLLPPTNTATTINHRGVQRSVSYTYVPGEKRVYNMNPPYPLFSLVPFPFFYFPNLADFYRFVFSPEV